MNKKYEEIKSYLEHGFHVPVKNENGKFCIISPFKDKNNDYRKTHWEPSLEIAKQLLGCSGSCYTPKGYKDSWEVLEPFMLPYKRYEVGQKVVVRDNAKEIFERHGFGWYDGKPEMVGKELEIKGVSGHDYGVWNEDKTNSGLFPHEVLYPVISTEEKTILTDSEGKRYEVKIIKELE